MGKKGSTFKKRLDDGMLNAFAVALTIFPLFSLGYFGYNTMFSDPRDTTSLSAVAPSSQPNLFKEGLVSVTFDDGWENIYSEGAALFSQYGIPTTQYILPGEFDNPTYLSVKQVKSLQQAGHEIASHTMTHPILTTVNNERVVTELTESKAQLLKHKLSPEQINFASPESATNDFVDGKISSLYASHRNTFGDIENGIDSNDINVKSKSFDRYNIIGYTINSATKLEYIEQAIKYAKANNGWLVLVYHQVDSTGSQYSITPDNLEKHLKTIQKSGIKTATISDVLRHSTEGK